MIRITASLAALALSLAACSETTSETGGARGGDGAAALSALEAVHGDSANDYKLSWKGEGPVTIEVSTDPAFSAGEGEVIGTFEGGSAEWSAEGDVARRYFLLSSKSGASEKVAVRLLPLEGGRNFRDLGGYETEDGKTVKWGRVYRSGVMSGLTDGDYEYLSDLGITTVCDFREADERDAEPTDWRAGEIEYMTFAPPADDSERAMFAPLMDPESTPEDVRQAMAAGYPGIAEREGAGYTAMFDQLAAGSIPLAFNCSAGKDRAGTAAAMLLTALGVPRETVVADYALSGTYVDYMKEFVERADEDADGPYAFLAKLPREKVAPLMESNPIYIESTLDAMAEKHGSVLDYIKVEFDVTDEELTAIRTALLQ
ncbi:MAG: tyrosine-protein phosphatase [Pseudomonadota bacterium]